MIAGVLGNYVCRVQGTAIITCWLQRLPHPASVVADEQALISFAHRVKY